MQVGHSISSNYDAHLQENGKIEHSKSIEQNGKISSKGDLSTLKEGAAFRAQILDIVGDKVKIILEDKTQLYARLQDGVKLGVGDQLLFTVKENTANQILIKPMFDSLHTAQTQVLEKALDMAGLSFTEKNFSVAKELMEAGMPVDKANFVKVLSQSLKFEGTSMQNLVALNKMNIPVTKENIAQYERYQNYNHQMTGDIENTVKSIVSFSNNFPPNTSGSSLTSIANQILNIFTSNSNIQDNEAFIPENNMKSEMIHENNLSIVENKDVMDIHTNFKNENILPMQDQSYHSEMELSSKMVENVKDGLKQVGMGSSDEISSNFGIEKENLLNMEHLLKKEGVSNEEFKYMIQNSKSADEFLKNILNHFVHLEKNDASLKRILQSNEFKDILSEVIKKQWTLNPKNMKDSKEIEDLYNKIIKQSTDFQNLISTQGGDLKEFNQSFQNMKQNMQFIEQLNHQMIYTQMPLKLSNQNTNSELYVYADKRKLMEKKDGISVMLHLDMDHLGMTDVKVTLTGTNVNARFYLNDQESVDIVTNHMNELAKQLADRGFSLTNEVVKREPQESINKVVDEIIDENAEKSIKRYTFDARM